MSASSQPTSHSHHSQLAGERLGQWILNNKILTLLLSLAFLAIFLPGLPKVHFNSQYRYYFGPTNPQLQAFDQLQRVYAKEDNILIALAPQDGQVFKKETLKAIQALTEQAWQTPFSTRVDSITNFQHTEADGDELIVQDLVEDPDSLTAEDLVKIKQVALSEPVLNGRIISDKGNITGVNILVNIPGKDPLEVPDTANFVRAMVDDWKKEFPGHDTYLTGVLMLNNAFVEAGQTDMQQLTPLMYLFIFIIMAILLRSISAIFASLVVIVLSVLCAMGFAGWFGIPLSPTSAIAPTIVLTMSIADSVHFLVSMFGFMRAGQNKRDAIIESLRVNLTPIILTSVTTMIGFLALNSSDSPPYQDLGNISAAGVGAALVFSVFLLPVLIYVLPTKVKQKDADQSPFFSHLAEFVIRNRKALTVSLVFGSLLVASFIPRLEINDRFLTYFDSSIPFRPDSDFVQENLTGVYQFEYNLSSQGERGITDPTYLQTLERFSQWIRQQEDVKHVWTFSDVIKRINKSMNGDDPAFYTIPNNKELAAQYLLLYEMSLPFGLDITNQVNIKKSATRLVVTIDNISTKKILALNQKIEDWLKTNAPPTMHAEGSGPTIMFSHITERNIRAMVKGTVLAFILITLMMICSLRSVKYGLISLVPNVFPAVTAFGLWSLFKGEVGFAISVVASATLGIIVDDTVHFLSKYVLHHRESRGDPAESVRYSFRHVGTALLTTSLILIIGFGVLSFSAFKLNATLGILSALTIAVALLTDFFLLPSILLFSDQKKSVNS